MEHEQDESLAGMDVESHFIENYLHIPNQLQLQQQQVQAGAGQPPRRRAGLSTSASTLLPVANPHSARRHSPSPYLPTWICLLLLLVLLFWFRFSFPVNLSIKDGRTMQFRPTEMPLVQNDTVSAFDLGHLTILVVSNSPNPSFHLSLTMMNDTSDGYPIPVPLSTVSVSVILNLMIEH